MIYLDGESSAYNELIQGGKTTWIMPGKLTSFSESPMALISSTWLILHPSMNSVVSTRCKQSQNQSEANVRGIVLKMGQPLWWIPRVSLAHRCTWNAWAHCNSVLHSSPRFQSPILQQECSSNPAMKESFYSSSTEKQTTVVTIIYATEYEDNWNSQRHMTIPWGPIQRQTSDASNQWGPKESPEYKYRHWNDLADQYIAPGRLKN